MGSRTERLLIEDAAGHGYVGIRVDIRGAEGYTSGHDAGDVILGRAQPEGLSTYSDLYVIEEKYKSTEANRYLQEDGEKIDAMIEFAEALGATPVIACRWSTQTEWSPGATHFLRDVREVERTASGNLSIKPETAEKEFQSTEEYFSG